MPINIYNFKETRSANESKLEIFLTKQRDNRLINCNFCTLLGLLCGSEEHEIAKRMERYVVGQI